MATAKKPARKKSARKRKPRVAKSPTPRAVEQVPVPPSPVVDRRTDERRIRVLQLWGKKEAQTAEILLQEGFEVDSQPRSGTISKEEVQAWNQRRVDSMRRNVHNDKEWWRQRWRENSKAPRNSDDLEVERQEYIASLQTDLDDIDDILADRDNTKSTAKGILIGEKRQTRQAIAKAKGIEQGAETPRSPTGPAPLVIGVSIGTANVSDEMKQRLRAQGVRI